jgi:long-chain acyl-CoA synthetase
VTGTTMALRTIGDLPFVAADRYGERPAWRYAIDGAWVDRTYREVADEVRALAAGLVVAGIAPGDRVCVLAETSPQWAAAGLAVLAAGGALVPIYPSSSARECGWIAGDSGARMVICESFAQLDKLDHVWAKLPDMQDSIVIDEGDLDLLCVAGAARSRSAIAEVDRRRAALQPDDPSVIIYTSGTTGPAKGCVLTHRNWLTLCALNQELNYVCGDDVVYLFLPLADVLAQMALYTSAFAGATLAYFGGDQRQVIPELAQLRPTILPSAPRVFEKVYTLFARGVEPERLAQAVGLGLEVRRLRRAGLAVPPPLEAEFAAADELFAKVRAIFGGRLRMALTGATPISPAVLEFFHAAGVPVLEGYGMTETSGIGTVNTLDRFRIGAVGVAPPRVELRIGENGEVLMRGPHLFAGYWREPRANAATLVNGWLHTGDLGALDADGYLTITGRLKDTIVTAGGGNIAPANLENELRQSRWISHAVLYGDRQPYLVALLTLDADEILPWARERGLPSDLRVLAGHPEVRALVTGVVDAANARHARAAQVKRFAILPRDLSRDAGELTPKLKVKRAVVYANHADALAGLYGSMA